MEVTVRYNLLLLATVLLAPAASPAVADYCVGGQQPAPPSVARRMALPLCGNAATEPWGPNGCQLCDARNMYPNPFYSHGPGRTRADRLR